MSGKERWDSMDAAEGLGELLRRYGIEDDSREARAFHAYLRLLQKWNSRINLTASTEWHALCWLFEEALWAAQFYPTGPTGHLDIGSGAGFPALLLRILRPAMRLCLVEGRSRRAAFLETVVTELRLEETAVFGDRIEEFLQKKVALRFQIVSWKALKLGTEAFRALVEAGRPAVHFWLFHGPELPLQDPAQAASCLRLLRRETFGGHAGSCLSIFAVSRETALDPESGR